MKTMHTLIKKAAECINYLPLDTYAQKHGLVLHSSLPDKLIDQIQFDSSKNAFTLNLIDICIRFGKLPDGRLALVAVLETARVFLGENRHELIDSLLLEIQQDGNSDNVTNNIQSSVMEQRKKAVEFTFAPNLSQTSKRWSLIVGVNNYDDEYNYGPLSVCEKDATTIYNTLLLAGYDADRSRLLTDTSEQLPTKDNILIALKAMAIATEPEDVFLFYYSGHGDDEDGESYLITKSGKGMILEDTALKISRVKEIMQQAPAQAKVIVIDACHSGAKLAGKGPKYLTLEFFQRVFNQAMGLAILASCKQGQLSYEWEKNERSVFTYYFLEAISGKADTEAKGFVTIQDANRYVSNGVKLWASTHNLHQTPTLVLEISGDIILAYVNANVTINDEV